jgi:hypothetical protein
MRRFSFLLALMGIAGALLNAMQLRIGFAVWIASNMGMIMKGVHRRDYHDALLFAVYLCLSVWGLISWE